MGIPLKVNWSEVETAFERNSPGLHSYIDRATGHVVVVVDGAPEDEPKRRKIADQPAAYVKIEPASSREQYRWMERFVASVKDSALRDRLVIATDGRGAFRRFKDVLLGYAEERERWFNHRADLLHHHINMWFRSKDLDPDPPMPWGDVSPPPEPPEPLVRSTPAGDGPADLLRKQVKALIDLLPAGELYSAKVFVEYLRDRGSAELSPVRGKLDPHRPFKRRHEHGSHLSAADCGGEDDEGRAQSLDDRAATRTAESASPNG
jgi:hypothetical protein